jgi:hypothetical protein
MTTSSHEIISYTNATQTEREFVALVNEAAQQIASLRMSHSTSAGYTQTLHAFAQTLDLSGIRPAFINTQQVLCQLSAEMNAYVVSQYSTFVGETEARLYALALARA